MSYLKTGEAVRLAEGAVRRRYFRLMPPIVLSVVVSWCLVAAGLYFDGQVKALLPENDPWLPEMPTSGSLLWALYEGLFGAIFHFEAPGSSPTPSSGR